MTSSHHEPSNPHEVLNFSSTQIRSKLEEQANLPLKHEVSGLEAWNTCVFRWAGCKVEFRRVAFEWWKSNATTEHTCEGFWRYLAPEYCQPAMIDPRRFKEGLIFNVA